MEVTVYMTTGEVFTLTTDDDMTIVKFCKLIEDHVYIYDEETCVKSESIIAFTL